MNFQATAVRSAKDFFQMAMTGAALMVGWTLIGGIIVHLVKVLWNAILRMI